MEQTSGTSTETTDPTSGAGASTTDQASGTQNGNGEQTQTDKPFDKEYVQTLRKEAAGYRTELAQTRTRLQELEDRDKSEQQRTQEAAQRSLAEAEQAKVELARYKVIATKAIPPEWQDFLHGTTQEELEANADKLLERIKGLPTLPQDLGQGARLGGGDAGGGDFSAMLRKAAGR